MVLNTFIKHMGICPYSKTNFSYQKLRLKSEPKNYISKNANRNEVSNELCPSQY